MTITATYSPEDNKLRLYPSSRLDKETYERVRAAGFIWAPRQELFVAPMWTPGRADLAEELAGEIGDEDTSLVERAEERAGRFEGYRENRTHDAEAAHKAVSAIADGIPLGQPILVGHHSERHARRDAEKIENGMRKAVKMWETAEYWKSRAAGALRSAKYKELPAVRARRIKKLESELRCEIASFTPQSGVKEILQSRWNAGPDDEPVPHAWCGPKGRGGRWVPVEDLPGIKAGSERWIQHYENRIAYEYAMLGDAGGLAAEKFNIEVGGQVKRRGNWYVVTGLNRREGELRSVSVIGHWEGTIQIEEIGGYEAPKEGAAEKIKKATKNPPLVNWRAPGCVEMTMADWKNKTRWSDSNYVAFFAADHSWVFRGYVSGEEKKPVAYRQRSTVGKFTMPTGHGRVPVFLVDQKVVLPPGEAPEPVVPIERNLPEPRMYQPREESEQGKKFEALREGLRKGVTVVSAPQLFPTPPEIAKRMVEIAAIEPGDTVLEPSAGTGNIVRAIIDAVDTEIVGYEINSTLAAKLSSTFPCYRLHAECRDFLEVTEGQGQFPRVLMNPPFENGADIKHIRHALQFVKPGGRLVALCANGPRQNEVLKPMAEETGGDWEVLPDGSFSAAGTNVRVAMLTIFK